MNRLLQHLLLELKNYEENQNAAKGSRPAAHADIDQQMGVIPVSTWLFVVGSLTVQLKSLLYTTNIKLPTTPMAHKSTDLHVMIRLSQAYSRKRENAKISVRYRNMKTCVTQSLVFL